MRVNFKGINFLPNNPPKATKIADIYSTCIDVQVTGSKYRKKFKDITDKNGWLRIKTYSQDPNKGFLVYASYRNERKLDDYKDNLPITKKELPLIKEILETLKKTKTADVKQKQVVKYVINFFNLDVVKKVIK